MRDRLNPRMRLVVAGALTLAAVVGISRFFFTAILPRMQEEHAFTAGVAGLLATSNLAGYLLGVLVSNGESPRSAMSRQFLFPILINVLAVAATGLTDSIPAWIALRLVSGICSGLTFVAITLMISNRLERIGASRSVVAMYAGVGIGIACSGALSTLPLDSSGSWRIAASVMAAIIASALWLMCREVAEPIADAPRAIRPSSGQVRGLGGISVAYLLEGFGYIIGATFLAADFTSRFAFGFTTVGWLWAVVGLAAAPSCLLWSLALRRYSSGSLLRAAYLLQLIGCVLPMLSDRRAVAWLAAVTLGATFMGITSLSLYQVKCELLQPGAVARISALYAVGQMIGPAAAGWAADWSASRNSIWILAAVPIALAAAITSMTSRPALCRT
jgi:predicted MFS family arabinose efflux permease